MAKILKQRIIALKAEIEEIIGEVHQLAIDIGNTEMIEVLNEIRNRLHDPFMFVVVGEVKAGKSSFINALLETDRDICPVAPSPMTDTIQQIVYGEEARTQTINPYLKRIYEPVDILKEIAIVDTPGTNTIIEHHQEITERFIPSSDLIVFVFEAKNPYRQSSWDFFNLIKEDWKKKVIFILQQKDLMSQDDLEINLKGVTDHAMERGLDEPKVFAVSAKEEQEGKPEQSGYAPLRAYIREHITGGKAPILKLESSIETAANFLNRIEEGVNTRRRQLEADRSFREQINQTLDRQQTQAEKQVALLVENLGNAFENVAQEKKKELSSGLSFFSLLGRSLSSIFSKKSSLKEWLQRIATDIERDLKDELTRRINNGVSDLADSVQEMVRTIDLEIKSSETILKNDHELFSDIAERRASVMGDLRQAFNDFLQDDTNFRDPKLFTQGGDVAPKIATGSGLAVIGIILTAVTNGIVMDITGGVLTAIGILFASISVGINKRRILRKYDEEMRKGRVQIDRQLNENLTAYVRNLKTKIDRHFKKFDDLLESEAKQIKSLEARTKMLSQRIDEESTKIDEAMQDVSS